MAEQDQDRTEETAVPAYAIAHLHTPQINAEVLDYIPEFALKVRMAHQWDHTLAQQADELLALAGIAVIADYGQKQLLQVLEKGHSSQKAGATSRDFAHQCARQLFCPVLVEPTVVQDGLELA